jgi:diguanylate cyclase
LNDAEAMLHNQADEISMYMSEARTDPLTNLPNRRAFDEELARRIAEWRRYEKVVSILLVDIDHFKRFNDTYGHQTGDKVLQDVARLLSETMRESDLVARIGGEEIAMVLPASNADEASMAAERVRRAAETARFRHDEKDLNVTVSVGVAQCLGDEDAQQLTKRVDDALYAAKQGGRNRTYLHDGRRCVPISPSHAPVMSSLRETANADIADDSHAPSFSQVCQDLRRRLDEVAAHAGS